jgi:hypothetical protein
MLFIGDDWAEDQHDIAVVDETGGLLARRRLVEGVAGFEPLHALECLFIKPCRPRRCTRGTTMHEHPSVGPRLPRSSTEPRSPLTVYYLH